MIRVLLAQMRPEFNMKKNKSRLINILERKKADIYIFPEMYLTGYLIRDAVVERAINRDDSIMREIARKSEGRIVIFGFPERDDFIYNSAAVIVDGEINIARKIYLPNFGPFEEKLYFKEGKDIFVVNTELGKIGVQICYDLFFPEISKIQALRGAKLVINISASPITSRYLFEKIIPARAIENTVFLSYVNWAGLQRTMEFWGGSQIYSPRGNLIFKAPYFEESIDIVEINMDEIEIAKTVRPTLRDTRRDFFNL